MLGSTWGKGLIWTANIRCGRIARNQLLKVITGDFDVDAVIHVILRALPQPIPYVQAMIRNDAAAIELLVTPRSRYRK